MLKNYLKSAARNLWRQRGYSLINILGLSIGMACVILILLFVRSELSYDRHHSNMDSIYLLNIHSTNPQSGEQNQRAIGPYRLKDELAVDFSDLPAIVRIANRNQEAIEVGDKTYVENRLAFVDPEVLEVFTFPLLQGDPSTALNETNSLVITEAKAKKYFGSTDVLNRTVSIRGEDFVISGILAPPPKATQFPYEILVSMNSAQQVFSRIVLENWGEGYVYTFVMTDGASGPKEYEHRLADFTAAKLTAFAAFSPEIRMHPMKDLYLDSGQLAGWLPGGDRTYVLVFGFIALFILIIACINFINLATARSSLRAREVGLRKVIGAERKQLIGQFLTESVLLSLICLVLAIVMTWIALPYFNVLADRTLDFPLFEEPQIWIGLVGIALIVGVVSGSYPALILSGFEPIKVLTGKLNAGLTGAGLRKILVTFQFATSILLLIVTGVVARQLDYCKNLDLGFDKEQLVILPTTIDLRGKYNELRTELLANPRIINAAASSRVPPGNLSSSLQARPEGVPEDQQRGMQTVWTDYDFIETMGLEIVSGRSFSRDFPADARTGFILNEAAVKEIGWTNESAINKTFGSSEIRDWGEGQWENRDGKVIGILKDFHFESLKKKIIPTVYFISPYMAWNYVVRISNQDIPKTIDYIKETYAQFIPDTPFEYTFVDENFAQLYANEERQGKIFTLFASLAIFIGCLGLIGLASFTAERKKKEVGIRKVLGANATRLIYILSREFTLLILLAFLIASPIAWYVVKGWLTGFEYQVAIRLDIFLIAGLITLLIAWLTVAFHIGRAALANPIGALRQDS